MAPVKGLIKSIFKDTYKASKVAKKAHAAKKGISIFTEAKPVTSKVVPKEIPPISPVPVQEVAQKGIKAKISKAVTLFKSILKDIYDVRKMPKGVYTGWKEGAEIAKKSKQNIVAGVGTRAKEATKQGVAILKFECDEYERHYGSSYDRCAAQDTKYTKLEDKIEHIINVLEEIADNRDERDRQRKLEEERKRQEEERKRQEEEERKRLQALKDAELEKVKELIFKADRLKISKLIREYIEEFKLYMQEQGISDEMTMENEIEWMKKKADFIDPFVNLPDDLLSQEDIEKVLNPEIIKTSESKPSYGYYHSEPQYSYWQIKNMWRK